MYVLVVAALDRIGVYKCRPMPSVILNFASPRKKKIRPQVNDDENSSPLAQ